jgi:hypothetical protein
MIVAIHQPQYLPWIGYFHKIDRADKFVLLDNVQYKKNEWQNRNKIKNSNGWQWITLPVIYRFGEKIKEIRINNRVQWRKKHLHSIFINYRRAPYFKEYFHIFEDVYSKEWEFMVDINKEFIRRIMYILGIEKELILASKLGLLDNDPTDRLVNICIKVGGNTYLSGRDGAKYMNLEKFKGVGLKIIFQDFRHPVYPQLYGNFIENLSIIDLLFNCGDRSINILRGVE